MSQGKLPVAEALRYSMMLAETLRRLHENGKVHGAVSPASIHLTGTGLDLLPPPAVDTATAYQSPEVLEGRTPDARSDIFSFGAVLYELLTGRRPFEGRNRGPMAPSGSPAVDRLVGGCVALDPAARMQRIQKVMLELKLLAVSAARAAALVPPRRDPGADAQLRAEMEQLEARLAARLRTTEKGVAETQRLTAELVNRDAAVEAGMRTELLQLEARMAARLKAGEKALSDLQMAVSEVMHKEPEALRAEIRQVEARLTSRMEQIEARLDALEKVEAPAAVDTSHIERSVEEMRRKVDELHDRLAQDFQAFEKTLHTQSAAIESARTAMSQTDDLVERVVEALESLQATVLEYSDEHTPSVN